MKIKIKILCFLVFLFSGEITLSQNTKSEYALYNIGLGGVVGGFGAVINKGKEEKTLKVFANGFWRGAIGGGTIHVSKISVGEIAVKQDYSYSWLAKATNSLGTSFVENATLNKPLLSKFHLNVFAFNRIEFSTQEKLRIKYKLMPVAFLMTSYIAATTHFEFEKTVATGEFVFSSEKIHSLNYRGYTVGTTIVMNTGFINNKDTFAHELIHVYQYYDYNFINSFLNKPFEKLRTNSKFFSKLDFLYFDVQAPFLFGVYSIEKSKPKYYDNFFEKEAGFYPNTLRGI